MRTFLFTSILLLSSTAFGQSTRHRVYPPTYTGYGVRPGFSVYSNGTYSVDYNGSHNVYHYGYRPSYTNRRRHTHSQPNYYGDMYLGTNPYLNPYNPYWFGW